MAIMSLMLPDISDQVGEDRCPTAQFKKVKHNLLQKYDQVVDIQNPEGFGARSGEFIGEMLALGSVGKVIRVADGVSVFGMACEGGFVGGVVAEAHDTNKLAGVALGFAGGAGTGKILKLLFKTPIPKPLTNRTLTVRPELFSQEIRAIEAMQQPFYRSGFVTDKTALSLVNREVHHIAPMRLPPVQKGEELMWLSENAPKIRQLKEAKGINRFDRYLKQTFKDQNLSELQVRRVLNYAGFNTYPRPLELPGNVIVELSKENGGMVYRLAGTSNKQNILIRVSPGLGKESRVTSVINGEIKHGQWHQQTPYVVQMNNKKYLTVDGKWIDEFDPVRIHIPLETYKFKGWE